MTAFGTGCAVPGPGEQQGDCDWHPGRAGHLRHPLYRDRRLQQLPVRGLRRRRRHRHGGRQDLRSQRHGGGARPRLWGRRGAGYGAGNSGGARGYASLTTATAEGLSTAGAYVVQTGGAGGGAGAKSVLTNAVGGSTADGQLTLGQLTLGQTATGGNGGYSDGGTAGAGGAASSSETFNDTAGATRSGTLTGSSTANGGLGGTGAGTTAGGGGARVRPPAPARSRAGGLRSQSRPRSSGSVGGLRAAGGL